MQFNFDVQQALGRVSSKVVANGTIFVVNGEHLKGNQVEQVRQIVDSMGHASGKAQKLPSTITTLGKLQANEHIIFIKAEQNKCIGFLKVGYKKLFVRGRGGEMHEMKPLSVLDFFVDASVQRGGYGRALFDIMLTHMNSKPALIAYDRPSHKLMGFLAKHFQLQSYVQQNNNYVVFDDYFQQQAAPQQPEIASNKLQGRHSEAMTETMRQSTNYYDQSNSVFGQSHMSSFQKAAQPSLSQHQTLSGGWGPVKANQDAAMSQQRTHYPRQSHHNQQFRIGDGSNEKKGEVAPSQNAHIRTQAHTFGHNSNSIASNGSQMFQQTHSSNGFGSTFMSSNHIRQSQQQSTAMKFGNVGHELISKPGNPTGGLLSSIDRSKAQATLNDFKQSFTQLSSLQRHNKQNESVSGGGVGPSQRNGHQDPTQIFQTSYQSQFVENNAEGSGIRTDPRQSEQNHVSAKFGQYGYSPFQAFANRQQSLPSPQQQQAVQQSQPSQGQYHQYGQQQQQTSRTSEFRTVNAKSGLQPKNYTASFSGNFQDAMTETSQAKALSMPATQRMLNHRATRDSQSQFATVATRPYNQSSNHASSYSYSAGHALSPATGGSKAAQFMQHQQQFQPSKGPLASVWQSQDGGAYRNSQHFSRGSGLRNF